MRHISEGEISKKRRVQNALLRFALLTVICLVIGSIDGFRSYVSTYHDGRFSGDFADVMSWDVTGWLIWIGFIPFTIWLCHSFPITQNNWAKAFAVFLPVGFGLALARTFFPALIYIVLLEGLTDLQQWLPGKFYILVTDFIIAFSFYLLVLAFGQAINYYKRYREEEMRSLRLEAQFSKAQLDALKMQLQPHFLFNALNSISAMQMENAEAAQKMIVRLGDFLRLTLENVGTQEVTLEREIEFLRCYLEIERVRFGHRLTTDFEVAPEILSAQVPNLILQPLVENALKHGVAPRKSPCKVVIRAIRENGWVKVQIEDNGKGIEANAEKYLSVGLGLSNTQSRLRQLYGANFRFDLQNVDEGGLQVTILLPHKEFTEEIKN